MQSGGPSSPRYFSFHHVTAGHLIHTYAQAVPPVPSHQVNLASTDAIQDHTCSPLMHSRLLKLELNATKPRRPSAEVGKHRL